METTQSPEGEDDYSSDDDTLHSQIPSSREAERTPSERNAFLFRHNLGLYTSDLSEFHPLPSQVPFLLNIFHDNVNFGIQIVHLPTIQQMVRDVRVNGMSQLSPAEEALMFAIYYAAITSMEEDDVSTVHVRSPELQHNTYVPLCQPRSSRILAPQRLTFTSNTALASSMLSRRPTSSTFQT